MLKLPVYLDYNATTPVDPRVLETMLPYFSEKFGNAASKTHSYGWIAEDAVELAQQQVAGLINCEPNEIIFTSGATESINLALKGVFESYKSNGNHIITISTEHKAVLDTCNFLEKLGATITYLPVMRDGLIDRGVFEKSFTDKTILVAVMYANNETGVIQQIKELANYTKSKNVIFFTDATQALGKILIDVQSDNIDLMAFSAHKIYGPKGVGALYVRRKNPRVRLAPQIHGGGHQKGFRSGTLNVPGIVGFGKSCEICKNEMATDSTKLFALRNKLESELLQLQGVKVNGNTQHRLSHVSNLRFANTNADELITKLNPDMAVATGSACTSATQEPSHVLKAMGLSDEEARHSIRFSLGRFTTENEIDYVVKKIKEKI